MTRTHSYWTNEKEVCGYCPEFADKALEVINAYIIKYRPETKYYGIAQEVMIRHLLYSESVGYNFSEDQRDYYIKTSLGIIKKDEAYEKQIGYFGKSE